MLKELPKYSIVVPLYNEELVIQESYKRMKYVMDSTMEPYEILFVNDGSHDKTMELTREICKADKNIKLISFSRNFGHQNSITAGMNNASGEAIIVIDADLQDPPEIMIEMIHKWKEGFEVVYGKRIERKGETFFKKMTARLFYRFLSKMTDINIPVDTGDFRLIDRKVCEELKNIPERNRYVRGLISWLGFKQTGVEFVREQRFAGETKYPFKKMIKFASDAITGFSYKPLRLSSYMGISISIASFIYLLVILYQKLFTNLTIPGWTSIVAILLLFNGFTFMFLGIVGEYIGRIYDETKSRPLYIIAEKEGFE